jgi:hypothetical protein
MIVWPRSFVCRRKAVDRMRGFLTEPRHDDRVQEPAFSLRQFKVSLLGWAATRPHLVGAIGSVLRFAGRDPQLVAGVSGGWRTG